MKKKVFKSPIELVGAIKIKDGLFLGDQYAAQVCRQLSYEVGPGVYSDEQSQIRN